MLSSSRSRIETETDRDVQGGATEQVAVSSSAQLSAIITGVAFNKMPLTLGIHLESFHSF